MEADGYLKELHLDDITKGKDEEADFFYINKLSFPSPDQHSHSLRVKSQRPSLALIRSTFKT